MKSGDSDEQIYKRLKSLIYKSEQSKREMFLSAENDCRNYEPRLEKLIYILPKLYEKLKAMELLNIPNDEDPFNCYCFHVANYFAMEIMKMLDSSQLSLKSSFVEERERLVLKSLKTCNKELRTFGTNIDPAVKKRIVLVSLERLEKENNSLIKNHNLPSSISFPGFFSSPSLSMFSVETGALQQCINKAKKEINSDDIEASVAYSL